jgi:hypothetical protein
VRIRLSHNPASQDGDYYVDLVIVWPEKPETPGLDFKFLLELRHYVMNVSWPNALT